MADMSIPEIGLLTDKAACKILGISPANFHKGVSDGYFLPRMKCGPRTTRFSARDLRDLIQLIEELAKFGDPSHWTDVDVKKMEELAHSQNAPWKEKYVRRHISFKNQKGRVA